MDIDRAGRVLLLLAKGERGVKLEFDKAERTFGAFIQVTGGFGKANEVRIDLHAFVQTSTSTNRITRVGCLSIQEAVGLAVIFLSTSVKKVKLEPSCWQRLMEVYSACCSDEREAAFQTLLGVEHDVV